MKSREESSIIKAFLKEFFGADEVVLDDECVDICFTHTHVDPDDGQKDDVLSVASLKPNQRLANIIELARAMRETFPETSYPK